jgi:hypothetical protein
MFSCSDSEVNPLASILLADHQRPKIFRCQSPFPGAKSGYFSIMKKRAGYLLMLLSVLGALLLASCSENSAWQMGPEGIPLNSAPSGTSGSSSQY